MPQKILYLSPYFWPEEIGSAPYCTELAVYLAAQGASVQVRAFRPHYPNADRYTAWHDGSRDREQHHGVHIVRTAARARGAGGLRDRVQNDLRYLWRTVFGLVSGRYRDTDVIVAYVPSIFTLYAAYLIHLLTRARIIAVVHDIESGLAASLGIAKGRWTLRMMHLVERLGLNRADRVIVLTAGMLEELRALGCRRPIEVVPIWAAAASWTDPPALTRAMLMYSGNFGKKQNLGQLLPLLERIDREGVPIDVVLRGDGSERASIEEEVKIRRISNVRFLPFASSQDLTDSLQAASIHLVPQAQNVANYALPSKMISIMSAGRAFICIADKGSPLDKLALESGAGLCISPGDEAGLFAAVRDLAGDLDRQAEMGRNGQRYVGIHMEKSKILAQYEEIICGTGEGFGRTLCIGDLKNVEQHGK